MIDMNNLEAVLANKTKTLFMAHMIAGYPSVDESEKVAEALVKGGVDIIELQIPFSDPMADGPTIAVACEEALAAGATVASSMTLLSKVIEEEMVAPAASASSQATAMVGPSAIGSEKGICSSMISTPPFTSASATFSDSSTDG